MKRTFQNSLKGAPNRNELFTNRSNKLKKRAISSLSSLSNDIVPDYLREGLDIIFIGFNPGLQSAKLGHHYAGKNNHFYHLLYESGLVPQPVTYEDDGNLLQYSIGLTNICARTTRGSDELSASEMKEGSLILLKKLKPLHPKIICFNGMGVFETCLSTKEKYSIGLQREGIIEGIESSVKVFVIPSSSSRVSQYTKQDKLTLFIELKRLLEKL